MQYNNIQPMYKSSYLSIAMLIECDQTLFFANLVSEKFYLRCVLFYIISPITNEAKLLFTYLRTCIYSSVTCSVLSFVLTQRNSGSFSQSRREQLPVSGIAKGLWEQKYLKFNCKWRFSIKLLFFFLSSCCLEDLSVTYV